MRFQILSHAGLLVEHDGVQLLCDPWLVGSTYWRSWWNYPPPSDELVASLAPDVIYLTHVHWDHFQSVSLRRFPRSTPIVVPKGHFDRMRRDLAHVGFHDVTELRHGQGLQLAPDLRLTSYSFDVCDSAVVLEGGGTTLLNLNDSKIMGLPLKHLLGRHPAPDFVFCSHSSANSRACFEVVDDEGAEVDDVHRYVERFYQFAAATGTRYAVPFASNQCYLHRDTFRFNEGSQTPVMVRDYWQQQGITSPELVVMTSGDSWSSETGFSLGTKDWFTDRETLLREYQEQKATTLRKQYEREERAVVTRGQMEAFFGPFVHAIPFVVRLTFRHHPVTYVLTAGERRFLFQVDLYRNEVRELQAVRDDEHPLQIHVPAYVMRHAMGVGLLAHLGIGKRVTYRVTRAEKRYAERLKTLIDLHEYEVLPLRNLLRPRSLQTWALRWRELLLYANLAKDRLLGRPLDFEKQLVPLPPRERPAASGPTAAHGID